MIEKLELLNRFKKIHGNKYNYDLVEYKGIFKHIKILCSIHGLFEQTPNVHLAGSGCSICNSVKISKENFIKKCKDKHNNYYDYSLIDFKGTAKKIKIIYPEHGEFDQRASNHANGQKCPYCANQKWNTNMFIKKAIEIHGNKYDYSMVDYKKAHSKIKIICPEHGEFEQISWNHISLKEGCPYCGKNKSNLELFLKKANNVHKNKYNYSFFIKYTNNKEKIKIICPEHGEFIQQINNHLNGQGCPVCLESKGEKIIRNFLENNKIKFEQYKKFEKCKYKNILSFDFYLPEHNMCIEYDGEQHFNSIIYFGGNDKLEYTKKLDNIKENFCKNNNIKLYRIKYGENICDILLKIKQKLLILNDHTF